MQDAAGADAGEVVFVGHGIVAPEYNWNDYAGVDMKGKIALVMVNDPPATAAEPQLFGGPALTYYGRWTYKFEEAARQGAAGAILIHTDESATYRGRSCSRRGAARSIRFRPCRASRRCGSRRG